MKRRSLLKKILAAGIVAGSIASYPLLIEPNIIVKSEVHIKIEGIEKSIINIVHITDLHLKSYGLREKEAIKLINSTSQNIFYSLI
ncbi:MAG: hypothetical protein QXG36_09125 [Nitrososphaeria archaeon]